MQSTYPGKKTNRHDMKAQEKINKLNSAGETLHKQRLRHQQYKIYAQTALSKSVGHCIGAYRSRQTRAHTHTSNRYTSKQIGNTR